MMVMGMDMMECMHDMYVRMELFQASFSRGHSDGFLLADRPQYWFKIKIRIELKLAYFNIE